MDLVLVGLDLDEKDRGPAIGQEVRWPGDDRVWIWNGEEWVPGERTAFDGGDAWEDPRGSQAA